MESNDHDSDCVITDEIENRGEVLMINDKEPFLKRCKREYEQGFRIKTIPGDSYYV